MTNKKVYSDGVKPRYDYSNYQLPDKKKAGRPEHKTNIGNTKTMSNAAPATKQSIADEIKRALDITPGDLEAQMEDLNIRPIHIDPAADLGPDTFIHEIKKVNLDPPVHRG